MTSISIDFESIQKFIYQFLTRFMSDPPLSDIEFINKLTWVGTTYNFGRDFLINSKIFRIEYFFGPTKIGLTDLIRNMKIV